MSRLTLFALTVSLMLGCPVQTKNSAARQERVANSDKLDGIYEFVSESTVLTEPKKTAYKRTSPEWGGLWQFQDGYFTRVLMKGRRDTFFNPQKLGDFGFESSAGPYEIEGRSVLLVQTYTFNPLDVGRSMFMVYRFEGDTLSLTRTLQPYLEDLRKGTITTVMRRLN